MLKFRLRWYWQPSTSQLSTLDLTCLTVQVVKGIVLRTFGAGNAPDNNPDFLAALKSANDMGIVIINTTQCMRKWITVQAVLSTLHVLLQ